MLVGQLANNSQSYFVKKKQNQVVARGYKKGNIYALDEVDETTLSAIRGNTAESNLWHMRLRHPSVKVLQILYNNRKTNISKWIKIPKICVSCQLGKSFKIPFSTSNKISVVPLHKIHCDLWGPTPINSNQNF